MQGKGSDAKSPCRRALVLVSSRNRRWTLLLFVTKFLVFTFLSRSQWLISHTQTSRVRLHTWRHGNDHICETGAPASRNYSAGSQACDFDKPIWVDSSTTLSSSTESSANMEAQTCFSYTKMHRRRQAADSAGIVLQRGWIPFRPWRCVPSSSKVGSGRMAPLYKSLWPRIRFSAPACLPRVEEDFRRFSSGRVRSVVFTTKESWIGSTLLLHVRSSWHNGMIPTVLLSDSADWWLKPSQSSSSKIGATDDWAAMISDLLENGAEIVFTGVRTRQTRAGYTKMIFPNLSGYDVPPRGIAGVVRHLLAAYVLPIDQWIFATDADMVFFQKNPYSSDSAVKNTVIGKQKPSNQALNIAGDMLNDIEIDGLAGFIHKNEEDADPIEVAAASCLECSAQVSLPDLLGPLHYARPTMREERGCGLTPRFLVNSYASEDVPENMLPPQMRLRLLAGYLVGTVADMQRLFQMHKRVQANGSIRRLIPSVTPHVIATVPATQGKCSNKRMETIIDPSIWATPCDFEAISSRPQTLDAIGNIADVVAWYLKDSGYLSWSHIQRTGADEIALSLTMKPYLGSPCVIQGASTRTSFIKACHRLAEELAGDSLPMNALISMSAQPFFEYETGALKADIHWKGSLQQNGEQCMRQGEAAVSQVAKQCPIHNLLSRSKVAQNAAKLIAFGSNDGIYCADCINYHLVTGNITACVQLICDSSLSQTTTDNSNSKWHGTPAFHLLWSYIHAEPASVLRARLNMLSSVAGADLGVWLGQAFAAVSYHTSAGNPADDVGNFQRQGAKSWEPLGRISCPSIVQTLIANSVAALEALLQKPC